MKKILLIIIPIILAIVAFFVVTLVLAPSGGKGALQVTSRPKSKVFLNGKEIGQTSLCKCTVTDMLDSGEYTIRLVPENKSILPYEEKISITKSVLTVIDRTFSQGAGSEGSVITLRPLEDKNGRDIFILSRPQGAEVLLDNNAVGTTPLLLPKVTESDHEITVKKQGYREKVIRVRSVTGYKLEASVILGVADDDAATGLTPSPTPTVGAVSGTPSPSVSPATSQTVIILQTPTGFLRVRETGSTAAAEIGRVTPGETFDLVEEQNGWTAIKLKTGKTGWVSSQYVQKQ